MPTSLVKFASRIDGGDRGKLYWGRADIDGAPFRGQQPPLLSQEEFEARVTKVADVKNGTFRTWVEEDNKGYLDVLDKIANSWAECVFVERWRDVESGRHAVYIEWIEYYLEDGSRYSIPQGSELSYGSANLAQYFTPDR